MSRGTQTTDVAEQWSKVRKTAMQLDMRSGDAYFSLQIELKRELSELLQMNFILLPKIAIFKMLALCSSHRPEAPHVTLGRMREQLEARDL